jgi:uncharacterized protein YbaP (TraB family)
MRTILRAWFLVPLLAGCGGAEKPAETRFLWKVGADGTHVWLLGSIHVAKPSLYPLPPEIERAFAESKALVVEVDQAKADPAALQRLVAERGLFPPGQSLRTAYPEPRVKQALELAAKAGLPAAQAEQMRLWYLNLNATMLQVRKLGYDPAHGIDQHFIEAARKKGLPIKELESVQAQLDLLSGFSDELQGLMLESTLEEYDEVPKKLEEIFAIWGRGDAAALEKALLEDGLAKKPALEPVRRKLFDERNAAMAAKVEGYLKSGDVHFVVMGAGHLLGEQGVAALLRQKGYAVEQAGAR